MSVSIVVPFNEDGAERSRNWKYLRARYEQLYPDFQIVEGTCEGPWRKGVAVNAAVRASEGDVLVIADADVMVGSHALVEALSALEYSAWVVPHRLVFRLNEEATKALIEGRLHSEPVGLPEAQQVAPIRPGPAGGGISVMHRESYETAGGIDEGFRDWGGEDCSFARALDTLVGPHRCLANFMWHLHHEPMPRREDNRASPQSEILASRYLEAAGNPVAMADLLTQRSYEGVEGGGMVVARREVVQSVPLDARFVGWG